MRTVHATEAGAGRAIEPIDGIYNYCDQCCASCPLSHRCASYLTREYTALEPQAKKTAWSPWNLMPIVASGDMAVLHAWSDGPPTLGFADRTDSEAKERLESDPLLHRAREYVWAATPVVRMLRPIVILSGNQELFEELRRLDELCRTIDVKVRRAVASSLSEGYDPLDLQSDANGSAKVARLMVEESRRSWLVLSVARRPYGDEAPARLIAALDEIELGLGRRFPRALEFVRPGFDTDFPDLPSELGAEAVRRSASPEGRA